jgi:Family of unknown function (DUF5994)
MTIPVTPSTNPSRSVSSADPARTLAQVADADVRLMLHDHPESTSDPQTTLGGGWWPHTRELALELPLLVGAFAELGIRVTRVTYHPALWLIAPPKLRVEGSTVHLGWVRDIDPNLVSLRTAQDTRIELLVVPPEATADLAERAMAAAVEPGNHSAPVDILRAAAS